MRRCKAQMRDRSPGLVTVPPLQRPRGLELIKTSAKFYANGAGTGKPTIQLSCPVTAAPNNPTTIETLSSCIGKLSGRAVAMMCLLLLVLPGLGLVAIVWCGIRMADAGAPEVAVGEASSLAARLASSVVTRPSNLRAGSAAQTVSTDIIIHKVKTERIDAAPGESRIRDSDGFADTRTDSQ